jgi:hypothetical protein
LLAGRCCCAAAFFEAVNKGMLYASFLSVAQFGCVTFTSAAPAAAVIVAAAGGCLPGANHHIPLVTCRQRWCMTRW